MFSTLPKATTALLPIPFSLHPTPEEDLRAETGNPWGSPGRSGPKTGENRAARGVSLAEGAPLDEPDRGRAPGVRGACAIPRSGLASFLNLRRRAGPGPRSLWPAREVWGPFGAREGAAPALGGGPDAAHPGPLGRAGYPRLASSARPPHPASGPLCPDVGLASGKASPHPTPPPTPGPALNREPGPRGKEPRRGGR
ncbi:unnamed protein product [Rangifer tarandus platyrhynchus]|uniref:Uncharacterized protein n=1 Tax=Rangifer tarandus platyrhynchus TaxID=3082113 RepID=A0AC59ZLD3_RANTA